MVRVKAGQPRHTGFAGAAMFDTERTRPLTKSAVSAVASSAAAPDGLDWQTFSAAYSPGRRRHDLEALTAYGAYRRSHAADKRTSEGHALKAESGPASRTALQDWEDEGGAAL
jgi:hypothetical protein